MGSFTVDPQCHMLSTILLMCLTVISSSAIQDCQVIIFEATEITEETKNTLWVLPLGSFLLYSSSNGNVRSSPLPSFLAGVDEILERCISYCITQYVAHSFTRSVCGGEFSRW
jgi:peroxin-1